MSGCEEGRGDSECAQGDAGGGWRTSSPEPSGIKRANRGGGRGASCRIIQAQFCLPGDFHGPLPVTPWNQRGRSHGKSWNRLYPASTGAEPMPVRRKGVAATRLGLVFLRRSSPGGRPQSPAEAGGPEVTASGKQGAELEGRGSLPEGRAGRRAHLCSFSALRPFPAGSRPLEGWGATLGSQAAKFVLGHTAA